MVKKKLMIKKIFFKDENLLETTIIEAYTDWSLI